MISLDYLIFFASYLSVLFLVYSSVMLFYDHLKVKIENYNKREIENILDLYCKKAQVFGLPQKVEIFSYFDFKYHNACGSFFIKKGKRNYTLEINKL